MTCPACEKAKTEPTGLYYAGCSGCEDRAYRTSPGFFLHMQNVKRMGSYLERRQYFEGVSRSEGQELADLLKRDFADWFDAEKAKRVST